MLEIRRNGEILFDAHQPVLFKDDEMEKFIMANLESEIILEKDITLGELIHIFFYAKKFGRVNVRAPIHFAVLEGRLELPISCEN